MSVDFASVKVVIKESYYYYYYYYYYYVFDEMKSATRQI